MPSINPGYVQPGAGTVYGSVTGRQGQTPHAAYRSQGNRLMSGTKPLERLWRHWCSLPCPNGTGMPLRRALNIARLSDILPRLSLMQRHGPEEMTVGLVGTAVDSLWEAPITGMNAFDLVTPSMRSDIAVFYNSLLDHPCGAITRERVIKGTSKQIDVATLHLPLCDRSGNPSYIVGCSVFSTPEIQPSLKEHVITERRQLQATQFLDIGAGLPDGDAIRILNPMSDDDSAPARDEGWWRKFLPTGLTLRSRPDHH